jgi:hypothetical protein
MDERFFDWIREHKGAAWALAALLISGLFVGLEIIKNATEVFDYVERLMPADPVTIGFSADDLAALDGYPMLDDKDLGRVLAGGGKVRFFIQAKSADEIVTVDRIKLNVEKLPDTEAAKFDYKIDSTKQPGQGSPEVHRYYVTFGASNGSINYIRPEGAVKSAYPDLLAANPPRVMTLDSNAGLQEAIDLVMRPTEKGLFKVELDARVVTKGGSDEIRSQPIYIVRK